MISFIKEGGKKQKKKKGIGLWYLGGDTAYQQNSFSKMSQ